MTNSSNLSKKMTPDLSQTTCWVVTEGMIGTENQCVGVAEALGLSPIIKKITLKQPWKSLSPWLGFETSHSFSPALNPPWPDILIASGRKAVAVSRYIKKHSGGKTFTVQIQDPKTSPEQFDLVAVPYHDKLRGDNVIVTHGAPNRLTPEKILAGKERFSSLFKPMTGPRVAVLIGGNSRTHRLTADITRHLCDQLNQLDASLMITASRRTGADNLKIIHENLNKPAHYIWDGTGENPYLGILGWADYILVTSDSTSMLSDAGTTGKPVYVIDLEGTSKKFDRLHQHFREIGITRPFTGNLTPWTYEPLYDAKIVADEIRRKLG